MVHARGHPPGPLADRLAGEDLGRAITIRLLILLITIKLSMIIITHVLLLLLLLLLLPRVQTGMAQTGTALLLIYELGWPIEI